MTARRAARKPAKRGGFRTAVKAGLIIGTGALGLYGASASVDYAARNIEKPAVVRKAAQEVAEFRDAKIQGMKMTFIEAKTDLGKAAKKYSWAIMLRALASVTGVIALKKLSGVRQLKKGKKTTLEGGTVIAGGVAAGLFFPKTTLAAGGIYLIWGRLSPEQRARVKATAGKLWKSGEQKGKEAWRKRKK